MPAQVVGRQEKNICTMMPIEDATLGRKNMPLVDIHPIEGVFDSKQKQAKKWSVGNSRKGCDDRGC